MNTTEKEKYKDMVCILQKARKEIHDEIKRNDFYCDLGEKKLKLFTLIAHLMTALQENLSGERQEEEFFSDLYAWYLYFHDIMDIWKFPIQKE
jgi:hypothetical protein